MANIKAKGIMDADTSDVKSITPAEDAPEPSFTEEMKDRNWCWNIQNLPDGMVKATSSNAPGRSWIVSKKEFDAATNKDSYSGI